MFIITKKDFKITNKSLEIDKLCKQVLDDNNLPYHTIKVGPKSVKKIMKILGY